MKKKVKKILLAYSGGLDTSVSIEWLKDKYGAKIYAYSADVGQGANWQSLKEKALNTGAEKVFIDDIQDEFINNFAFKALKANALYEGKYPLATALTRPLIVQKMVEVCERENIDAVAHGCTGKGNDQVRFDVSFRTLAPELEIIAPLREWEFKSREEEMEYAKEKNIPIKVTKESPYSIDSNLWGLSVECGKLEDPWEEPPIDSYQWTNAPENTPDEPYYLTLTFDQGVPIKLNNQHLSPVEIVKNLNSIGSKYGIGRIDMVENRLVGIKSREIYEAPAATILINAHEQLESLTLDRETLHFKKTITDKYAEQTYFGLWYSPLREALDAFVESTQKQVTGIVKMKLYKGHCSVVGRKSPYSLYQYEMATYDENDRFEHKSAPGFIKLWGLPTETYARVNRENKDTLFLKDYVK